MLVREVNGRVRIILGALLAAACCMPLAAASRAAADAPGAAAPAAGAPTGATPAASAMSATSATSAGVAAVGAAAAEAPAGAAPGAASRHGRIHYLPLRGATPRGATPKASASDLPYVGGPVIPSAKVVFVFWGPSFADAGSADNLYAQELQAFRNQLGSTPEYNVITQYYQDPGAQHVQLSSLGSGTPDWFDTSTPPGDVTDASVRGEVTAYLASHAHDASTVYEVVIPSTSYSSTVTGGTSCGGPRIAYCSYHSFFFSGSTAVTYSIQPYPSCGGCQRRGWTAAENQEHLVTHETRESVTDRLFDAWIDAEGNEADDRCGWSPLPFIGTGGYGYQYEWSNLTSSCVQSIPIVGYFTVAPCRLYDSRTAGPLLAGDTYGLGIAGQCGIDPGATAVSVNLTVVNATADGFLSFWPAQLPYPGTSVLNFRAGQVRANNAILSLSPGSFAPPGAISLRFGAPAGSVDLIVDVNGYFK